MNTRKCYCGKPYYQTIGGFGFCFEHLDKARRAGAYFWVRLYNALLPWR